MHRPRCPQRTSARTTCCGPDSPKNVGVSLMVLRRRGSLIVHRWSRIFLQPSHREEQRSTMRSRQDSYSSDSRFRNCHAVVCDVQIPTLVFHVRKHRHRIDIAAIMTRYGMKRFMHQLIITSHVLNRLSVDLCTVILASGGMHHVHTNSCLNSLSVHASVCRA